MDCSICFDAITKQTGSTILSCEHSFHFRCIDEWFTKQLLDGLHQTCPCCRSEGAQLDRCAYEEIEDVEDDEEDYESETASEVDLDDDFEDLDWQRTGPSSWIVVNLREVAWEGLRNLFGPLNELDEDPRIEAIQKIQAVVRGHMVRRQINAAHLLTSLRN